MSALSAAYALLKTEPERGVSGLEELAGRGSLLSMACLGDVYRRGLGVPVDTERAKTWLKRATDEGSRVAPHQLGLLYRDSGEYRVAEEMFRLGASWNYLPSLYRLGTMYQDGAGVPRQPALARELLEKASSLGHVYAKRRLATLLFRGEGGPRNIARAAWLFAVGFVETIAGVTSDPNGERMRS